VSDWLSVCSVCLCDWVLLCLLWASYHCGFNHVKRRISNDVKVWGLCKATWTHCFTLGVSRLAAFQTQRSVSCTYHPVCHSTAAHLAARCAHLLCLHLGTNRRYLAVQHRTFAFAVCLLRGKTWIFKCQVFGLTAVGCRLLAAGAHVQSSVSPREICGVQSGTGTGYGLGNFLSPVRIIPPMLHTHLHLNTCLIRRTSGRSLGTLKQRIVISDIGTLDWKLFYIC
jgi:hypothetical protein